MFRFSIDRPRGDRGGGARTRRGSRDARIVGEFQERRYSDYVRYVAILVRPEHLPVTDFDEDVMQNRGVNLRYFDDDAEARAWLTESA